MYHRLGQAENWFERFTRGLVAALPPAPPPPSATLPAAAPSPVSALGTTPALVVGGLGLGALGLLLLRSGRRRR